MTSILCLLMLFFSYGTQRTQMLDEQVQVGLGASNYVETDAILTNEMKDGEKIRCRVENACHLCSFKELQQIAACQQTGYIMINRCDTLLKGQNIATNYRDESCNIGNDQMLIESGKQARAQGQPTSIWVVFVIFAALTFGSYQLLDSRRRGILDEVFSKLTIVKTN